MHLNAIFEAYEKMRLMIRLLHNGANPIILTTLLRAGTFTRNNGECKTKILRLVN